MVGANWKSSEINPGPRYLLHTYYLNLFSDLQIFLTDSGTRLKRTHWYGYVKHRKIKN